MRKSLSGMLLVLSLVACRADAQPRPQRGASSLSPSVEEALRKLDETELAAIRKRDVSFVDRVYASDVTLFPVYSLVKVQGRASAKEAWQSLDDRFAAIQKCEWSERVYRAAGPAAAWMTCLWYLSGTNSDGQPVELILRATRLYEKRRGRWVVVHENFSSPQR
jgi:ketosteroid isomerase-like protein